MTPKAPLMTERTTTQHQALGEGWRPLPADLHEALCTWAFNAGLECLQDGEVTMVLGGAVVDLRDLDRILDWAVNVTLPPLPTSEGEVA